MVEIPLFFSVIFFASPLASAFAAWERGRSFWTWLLIGTVLPGVALFLLYWSARREEQTTAHLSSSSPNDG